MNNIEKMSEEFDIMFPDSIDDFNGNVVKDGYKEHQELKEHYEKLSKEQNVDINWT